MKNLLLLALFIGAFSSNVWAQAPQAVCYQALAKDNQNNNILESTIGIRATIVRGSANGTNEWIEIHTPQTDQFGLFNIEIGQGTSVPGGAQTAFENIKWGNGEYWLRIEFDPFNGGNYQLMGANKIISVPYALYANGANTATSSETAITANFADSSAVSLSALTALDDDDKDASNELQTLSFQNGELSILDPTGNPIGAPVSLGSSNGGTLDDSNTNELQTLVNQSGELVLENADGTTNGAGVAFDPSSTNELQTLSFQNGELTILDPMGNPIGAPISLGSSNGGTLDDSNTNELQTLVNQSGELVLENADGTTNGAGVAFDPSSTNELQTLSFQNGELSILDPTGNPIGTPVVLGSSNGGTLDDSNTNELQTLVNQSGQLILANPDGSTNGSGVTYDPSSTNEIQNLVSQNGELVLQNPDGSTAGAGVAFDNSNTNEIQQLSIDGNTISISGGNTIELTTTDMPFSAPGASYDLPQGIYGEHIVRGTGNYTVPQGKTFWITAGPPSVKLKGLGVTPFAVHPTTPNMPALPSGQVVQDCMCTGVLIPNSAFIQPLVINFIQDGSYTVPEGKVFFVKSGIKNDEIGYLKVNNEPMEFLRSNFTRGTRIISFPAGTLIEPITSNAGDLILTGFLIDKDL